MRKLNAVSVISAVALVAITAYLAYGALANYRSYRQISALSKEFYSGENKPESLDSQIATVREHLGNSASPPLQLLLFDMLLFKAWYYPDESVAPLQEALKLGSELYRSLEPARGPIGAHLAFAYLYAGLPSKLPSWSVEVAARDPQYRAQLNMLAFFGCVASDDLAGAQELVDRETAKFDSQLEMRAMATAAYHALGLEHESRQHALEPDQLAGISGNLRLAYCDFLLQSGELDSAEQLLRANLEDSKGDPDGSLMLAVCLAMTRGTEDEEVQRLLATAAKSTRDPRSREGAEALCLAASYELDGNLQHAEQLLAMAELAQADFHVLAAQASLAQELADNGVDPKVSFSHAANAATWLDDPVSLARELLRAADTPGRMQDAHLQLALALAHAALKSDGSSALASEAATHFAAAIGSARGVDVLVTDRIPAYDVFLLDPGVIKLRSTDPEFDAALHVAVLDLLNRRRKLFESGVELPQVEFTH